MDLESLYVRPTGDRVEVHQGHDATCPVLFSIRHDQIADLCADLWAAGQQAAQNSRWTLAEPGR